MFYQTLETAVTTWLNKVFPQLPPVESLMGFLTPDNIHRLAPGL
jgi:hypothetical protein